jgi:hypothetical protein
MSFILMDRRERGYRKLQRRESGDAFGGPDESRVAASECVTEEELVKVKNLFPHSRKRYVFAVLAAHAATKHIRSIYINVAESIFRFASGAIAENIGNKGHGIHLPVESS